MFRNSFQVYHCTFAWVQLVVTDKKKQQNQMSQKKIKSLFALLENAPAQFSHDKNAFCTKKFPLSAKNLYPIRAHFTQYILFYFVVRKLYT